MSFSEMRSGCDLYRFLVNIKSYLAQFNRKVELYEAWTEFLEAHEKQAQLLRDIARPARCAP